jgi:hypothetical protein
MTQLTELNKISIHIILFFAPALFLAIFLAYRHGYGRNSSWLYLILLSVVRLLGAALELATIREPYNIRLYIGNAILQSVALSPLILCGMGLIARVVGSINNNNATAYIKLWHLRIIQFLVIVGLVLCVGGGLQLGESFGRLSSPAEALATVSSAQFPPASIIGQALICAGFGLHVVATSITALQARSIEKGERRLVLAVALAMPFLVVRLVFAAMGAFGSNIDFKPFAFSPAFTNYYLGMAVVMEIAATAVYLGFGLTLQRIAKSTAEVADKQSVSSDKEEIAMEEGLQYVH